MNKSTLIYALAAIITLLASCTSTNSRLEEMIPADAIGVIKIDMPEIFTQAGMKDGKTLSVPQDLKDIIDNNDDMLLSYLLRHLPDAGIDTEANAYWFFTKKTYRSVLLLALNDEDATRTLVERQTGFKFRKVNNIDFITIRDYVYVIDDGTLFIGRYNMTVDADAASRSARSILASGNTSLLDREDVRQAIDANGDITAYFEMKGLGSLLKKDETMRDMLQRFPLLGIFIDSDIKAVTAAIDIDGSQAVMKSLFIVDDKSEYADLLNVTLSDPSGDILKVIPASMQYIFSISIKGDKFVQLQQMQQTLHLLNEQAAIAGVDIGQLLSTVDGPLAIALSRDENLDDQWNAVLAARSNDPDLALKQISEFAASIGQAPMIQDGAYIYEYDSQEVKMGVADGIFFIKILGYDDSAEPKAIDLPDLKDFFASKRVGFTAQTVIAGKTAGYINYGLTDNVHGEGLFYTASEKDNAALTLIKLLCSIQLPDE